MRLRNGLGKRCGIGYLPGTGSGTGTGTHGSRWFRFRFPVPVRVPVRGGSLNPGSGPNPEAGRAR